MLYHLKTSPVALACNPLRSPPCVVSPATPPIVVCQRYCPREFDSLPATGPPATAASVCPAASDTQASCSTDSRFAPMGTWPRAVMPVAHARHPANAVWAGHRAAVVGWAPVLSKTQAAGRIGRTFPATLIIPKPEWVVNVSVPEICASPTESLPIKNIPANPHRLQTTWRIRIDTVQQGRWRWKFIFRHPCA